MVVNLCLPHFSTTVHCNKLCADGYDVTNLVSADPVLRRRGFKLEYFLRPPLQVTLKFGFQVELCRIDVELWPWGMDRGQACKRLEISTSSDPWPTTEHKQTDQKNQMKAKDQKEMSKGKHPKDGCKSQQSNGHHWSLRAQQWGEEVLHDHKEKSHAFKCQTNTESKDSEAEFKMVARCELTEETQICFRHSNFRPRAPLLSPPPQQPAHCRQEDLWSRGMLSLGAVTQLRVTVPFGGAASSLGLKALTVWGQPARCCPAEEVERINRIHEESERRLMRPMFSSPSVRQTAQPLQAPPSVSIPEEFLDPITQEVMMLPMLLPSGVSVDNTTLDEYKKREASWGRPPNDPFTSVSFSSTSQPLPNPQLKSRIDHFLLQKGMIRRDGTVGRQNEADNPQASRLVASNANGQSHNSQCLIKNSMNSSSVQFRADGRDTRTSVQVEDTGSGPSSNNLNFASNVLPLCAKSKSGMDRSKKRNPKEISKETTEEEEESTSKKRLFPQTKRPRNDSVSASSCSTHEKRLSASLDEALLSALKGRPSFTSNLPDQKEDNSNSDPQDTAEQSKSSGFPSTSTGEKVCSSCSCSVSMYSTAASPIYRLSCGHLLCRPCLQKESEPRLTPSFVKCPACQSPTARAHIIRVHH